MSPVRVGVVGPGVAFNNAVIQCTSGVGVGVAVIHANRPKVEPLPKSVLNGVNMSKDIDGPDPETILIALSGRRL